MTHRVKALILDRDGTLIVHVPYLSDPSEVAILPGVREGLRVAIDAGVGLFLHSNQSGVGRGFFSLDAVWACNRRMIELLDLGQAPFARICVAPEAPDQASVYRKPSAAFAREIAADYGFAFEELCYIGDQTSDLAAAECAGTRAVGVSAQPDRLRAEVAAAQFQRAYRVFARFDEAVRHVLSGFGPAPAFAGAFDHE